MSTEETKQEEGGNALVVIPTTDLVGVFTNPEITLPLLERIRAEALKLVPDVSTPVGRSQIRTLAQQIARTKTLIDAKGKALVDEMKDLPKQIDAGRRQYREYLDALKEEVRKPLTEYEEEQSRIKAKKEAQERAERERREAVEAGIAALREAPLKAIGMTAAQAGQALDQLVNQQIPDPEFFGDRQQEAAAAWAEACEKLRLIHAQVSEREAQAQAERDRLVAEAAERRTREEAEQKVLQAKLDAERAERERQEADRRAQDAERARVRAEQQAAEQAEQARQRAETAAARAAQEAERRAEEARQQERARMEAEAQAKAQEEARRAADIENRKKIHWEVLHSLMQAVPSITEDQAKAIIRAASKNQISRLSITY